LGSVPIIFGPFCYRGSEQVPVGQLDASDEDVPACAAKVENAFRVFADPHFSHACRFFAPGPSKNAVT
jgi:hypothetical protein